MCSKLLFLGIWISVDITGYRTFSQPKKQEQKEKTLGTTFAKTQILNQIDYFSAAKTFINSS